MTRDKVRHVPEGAVERGHADDLHNCGLHDLTIPVRDPRLTDAWPEVSAPAARGGFLTEIISMRVRRILPGPHQARRGRPFFVPRERHRDGAPARDTRITSMW